MTIEKLATLTVGHLASAKAAGKNTHLMRIKKDNFFFGNLETAKTILSSFELAHVG